MATPQELFRIFKRQILATTPNFNPDQEDIETLRAGQATEHHKVTPRRFNISTGPYGDNMTKIDRDNYDANGNTIFLPYGENKIFSVRIAANSTVKILLTAGLSACTIYVDKRNNNDIYFYHANAKDSQQQDLNDPTFLHQDAKDYMDAAHTQARIDYGIQHQIAQSAKLTMETYYQPLLDEIERKEGQGRVVNRAHAGGGCTVIGFKDGNVWKFGYQTYGGLHYKRPRKAPKGWFGHRDVDKSIPRLWKKLHHERFFPP
jgi:hypothetical protein